MTKSKLRKLLTKPKFRAWLEAKKPRAVVGSPCNVHTCPIARYMSEGTGENCTSGTTTVVAHAEGPVLIFVPVWCSNFVTGVDKSGTGRITASRALKILDGIK